MKGTSPVRDSKMPMERNITTGYLHSGCGMHLLQPEPISFFIFKSRKYKKKDNER